ncbi:MAG: insulinase family protein [Magnetococcales bacterium]|nr:insulinase family protein [Magnetococcales bacterium]
MKPVHDFRRRLAAWLWCLALWCPGGALALESRELRLENGLQVVLVRENKAPVAVVQVWYRVGAVDEKNGKTGLAHMLEHMMFQGTATVPPDEFAKIIAREGGHDNAATSQDFTYYYVKLAADRVGLALRLEADRMRNLKLTAKEFASENLVVREERRMRVESDPNTRMIEQYQRTAYGEHPYGRPVIGWMEELAGLTLEDLEAWYRTWYAPNNAILVVVGDIEFDAVEAQVREYFAPLPALPGLQREKLPDLPPQEAPRRLEVVDKQAKLPIWVAGYPTPTLAMPGSAEDVFALDLLSVILGHGSTSRLHRRVIREQGLAVSASSSYSGTGRSWELFSINAMPKPGVAPEALEKAIFAEVVRLTEEPVPERELEMAQNALIAEHVFAQDSIDRIAWIIGHSRANDLDWHMLFEEYPRRVRAVTVADLKRVAARYLRPERVSVGILKP